MRIEIQIQRYDPENNRQISLQDYRVEVSGNMSVLDALIKLKEETDGVLTFRCSCRSAICGSCAMEINGHEKLACKTQIKDELERHGRIVVKPLANHEIVKDLVVSMDPFWKKIKGITPWLIPRVDAEEKGTQNHIQDIFHNVDACILCGACVAACTTFEVSRGFVGPAALAKAFRFVADPRESSNKRRIDNLVGENGIWDCARCYFCWEVCPKDVRPVEAIIRMRRMALNYGFINDTGAKHITSFTQLVKKEGIINETILPIKMIGRDYNRFIKMMPLGLKMFFKRKLPFPFKRPIKGIKEIRNIFKLNEGTK